MSGVTRGTGVLAAAAVVLAIAAAPAGAAAVSFDLWAKTGDATMADGAVVAVWGFSDSAGGPAVMPGPQIEVESGDDVTVTLHNMLDEPVSIIFPGQSYRPAPTKDGSGMLTSFGAVAPAGGTQTYDFTAGPPGAFLYESGAQSQKQVHMGLFGPLIVRPAGVTGQAYDDPDSTFDVESVVILSEVDPTLHAAADGDYMISEFNPEYWLMNGKSYPQTVGTEAAPGQRVMLRCLNAGFQNHVIAVNGLTARVIGVNGASLYRNGLDGTYGATSVIIGSGEAYDLLVIVPTDAAPGDTFLVYDRDLLHLSNAGVYPGGMITRITATAAP